jgi:hypothetical protein
MQAAYQAGVNGDPLPEDATDDERLAHQSGAEERGYRSGRREGRTGSSSSSSKKSSSSSAGSSRQGAQAFNPLPAAGQAVKGPSIEIANQGAALIAGLIGAALVINYVKYGWPGVTGWLSAKFTNKVTIGAATSPSSGTPTAPTPAPPLPVIGPAVGPYGGGPGPSIPTGLPPSQVYLPTQPLPSNPVMNA